MKLGRIQEVRDPDAERVGNPLQRGESGGSQSPLQLRQAALVHAGDGGQLVDGQVPLTPEQADVIAKELLVRLSHVASHTNLFRWWQEQLAARRTRGNPGIVPRVTYADVTANISEWLATQPRGTKKALAAALGIDKTGLSHRMSGRYQFDVEQLLLVAQFAKAPPGWPMVAWTLAERLEALETLLSKRT